jgi:hypothetical protein
VAQIEIAVPLGGPLDCSDEWGADYDITELMGKLVRVRHVARDQIIFEVVAEQPPCWPMFAGTSAIVSLIVFFVLCLPAFAQRPSNWPKDLPFPEGMQRYRQAQWTQTIATTNERPRITPTHKGVLEDHWQQPGGLQGVPRSTYRTWAYKFLPQPPTVWVGRIPVLNRFRNYQFELGWRRSYVDGTFFCDVLENSKGKVFEIRYREKVAGNWENTIAYKDASARPDGFFKIRTDQCNNCHFQAGTGGYAAGLVQGGDTVLSDPFTALEF